MRAERLLAAAAAALLACAAEAPPGPSLTGVAPNVAYAGQAVEVRIIGRGFLVAARRTAAGDAELDTGYRAWLGDTELGDVRWVDAGTLIAKVPSTLPPGWHDLAVQDPYGARATLPAAFMCAGVQPPQMSLEVVAAPARVNTGVSFTVSVRARNAGGMPANGVAIELSAGGVAQTFAVGGFPAGAAHDVSATFQAPPQRGSVDVVARIAAGTDPLDGSPLPESRLVLTVAVDDPAALLASLSAPAAIAPGASVPVTLTITNVGDALALGVDADGPPAPVLPDSTAAATVLGTPSGGGVTLAHGESTTIVWTVLAGSAGTLRLSAGAHATDANDGGVRKAAATSPRSTVGETVAIAADPFGDGATSYARIAAYGGALFLGPSFDGTRIARIDPLAGGAPAAAFPVSIRYDWDASAPGSSMRNPYWQAIWAGGGPVTTFGSSLCDLAAPATCGPDLEDGQGTLVAGTLGGREWLIAGGAQSSGAVYLYASSAWTTVAGAGALDFAYLDLRGDAFPATATRVGAAAVAGDALWIGYVDQSGARPLVRVLTRAPGYPGVDASQATGELVDLRADLMPAIGAAGSPPNAARYVGLDAIASFGGRVYLANGGGLVRTAVAGTPRSYADAPSDWAAATPSAPEWGSRASLTLPLLGDLRPYQRAVPAMAAFGGSLFLSRNVAGPTGPATQLWRCTPAPASDGCSPGDWAIVTPAPGPDLTQLGDATNAAATILVATARYLYVGFDNAQKGAQLFRTAVAAPAAISAWTGAGGCGAGTAGCVGLGGGGLGDAASTRFVDAAVVTDATGASHLYVVVGDPVASPPVPVRVVEIPE